MEVFDATIYWKSNRPKIILKDVQEAVTHSPSGLFCFHGASGEKVFVNLSEVIAIFCSPKRELSEDDSSSSLAKFFGQPL